jgi:predicted metal-dependent enzyme (double-stranded beta helix superfamily)
VIAATTAINNLLDACTRMLGDEQPEESCANELRATLSTSRKALALKFGDARDVVMVHHTPALTMLVLPTPPHYWCWPHEHGMWAVTAMVIGAEEHVVYDRRDLGLFEKRRFRIDEGIVASMPDDVVHAAGNPGDEVSIGLHLFGGDPDVAQCLEWDPATGEARVVDGDTANRRRAAMGLA